MCRKEYRHKPGNNVVHVIDKAYKTPKEQLQ